MIKTKSGRWIKKQPEHCDQYRRAASNCDSGFISYFQNILAKKNQHIAMIDSPNLYYRLSELVPQKSVEKWQHMATITPVTGSLKRQQRKKYVSIKHKIATVAQSLTKFGGEANMRDVLQYKQSILKEFLSDFTEEIQKECKEKGQILRYIWNSMFTVITQIAETLSQFILRNEKEGLQNTIDNHKAYQSVIEDYKTKLQNLQKQSKHDISIIANLVYDLRFKRKEVNRLYKNQRLLLNKLNELKEENSILQSSYIDLMSTIKNMPTNSTELLLKARQQIMKQRHIKIGVQSTKKKNRRDIQKQMDNEKKGQGDGFKELLLELRQASKQTKGDNFVNNMLFSAIQNFGIKLDDKKPHEERLVCINNPQSSMEAETQVEQRDFVDEGSTNEQATQTNYSDKLANEMIGNRSVQTSSEQKKKIYFTNEEVQVSEELEKAIKLKKKMRVFKVVNINLTLKTHQHPEVVHPLDQRDKTHKKTYTSEVRKDKKQNETTKSTSMNIGEEVDPQASSDRSEQEQLQDADQLMKKPSRFQKGGKRYSNMSGVLSKFRENGQTRMSGGTVMQNGVDKSDPNPSKSKFEPIHQELEQSHQSSKETNQKGPFSPNNKKKAINLNPSAMISQLKKGVDYKQAKNRKGSKLNASDKMTKFQQDDFKAGFLQNDNYFNIQITAQKENFIQANFKLKQAELNFLIGHQNSDKIQQIQNQSQSESRSNFSLKRKGSSTKCKRQASFLKDKTNKGQYQDQNDLIVNLCRNKENKSSKNCKEQVNIYKYRYQFTSVKQNILVIAKDVKELITHKQELLKGAINSKKLKNTYKILMMTFSKAYDCFNKGVVMNSLVYPLYESFALVYGAINNAQIYKKMINFIACLCLNRDNTILRFFLFFLGLDDKSPYSQKLTIAQVYLCLKLLQKISIDGKVTMNIQSIYTDTARVQEQLMSILHQEKIPEELRQNVQTRVAEELQNSRLLQKSMEESFKINIYNIVIMIIQEVIKCKTHLKESFIPIFSVCPEYEQTKRKIPISLLQTILFLWNGGHDRKTMSVLQALKMSGDHKTMTVEQFCSLLFQCNLIHLNKLFHKSLSRFGVNGNWKIPPQFIVKAKNESKNEKSSSAQPKFQLLLMERLQSKKVKSSADVRSGQQKMQKILFSGWYIHEVQQLTKSIIGERLDTIWGYHAMITAIRP